MSQGTTIRLLFEAFLVRSVSHETRKDSHRQDPYTCNMYHHLYLLNASTSLSGRFPTAKIHDHTRASFFGESRQTGTTPEPNPASTHTTSSGLIHFQWISSVKRQAGGTAASPRLALQQACSPSFVSHEHVVYCTFLLILTVLRCLTFVVRFGIVVSLWD